METKDYRLIEQILNAVISDIHRAMSNNIKSGFTVLAGQLQEQIDEINITLEKVKAILNSKPHDHNKIQSNS